MIKLTMINGLWCPEFFCDACEERIDDPNMAHAAWAGTRSAPREGDAVPVYHVHKPACLRMYRIKLEEHGHFLMDAPLLEHLSQLAYNTRRARDMGKRAWTQTERALYRIANRICIGCGGRVRRCGHERCPQERTTTGEETR